MQMISNSNTSDANFRCCLKKSLSSRNIQLVIWKRKLAIGQTRRRMTKIMLRMLTPMLTPVTLERRGRSARSRASCRFFSDWLLKQWPKEWGFLYVIQRQLQVRSLQQWITSTRPVGMVPRQWSSKMTLMEIFVPRRRRQLQMLPPMVMIRFTSGSLTLSHGVLLITTFSKIRSRFVFIYIMHKRMFIGCGQSQRPNACFMAELRNCFP